MSLDRLWAGWRSEYVAGAGERSGADDPEPCVLCRIVASGDPDESTFVVRRRGPIVVVLNAYPYTSGHLMVLPTRHVADLEALTADESSVLWASVEDAVVAVKAAYAPEGLNVGINLGHAAGAGVPGHLHVHVLPRWAGDTNFTTAVAEARVLPESLPRTWERIRASWPGGSDG